MCVKVTQASVGEEIRRRREALGLTMKALGKRAKVHPFHIPAIEKGQVDVFLSTLNRIAKGLGCQVGELLGPSEPLGEQGLEVARLFDKADPDIQPGMLEILRGLPRKAGRS